MVLPFVRAALTVPCVAAVLLVATAGQAAAYDVGGERPLPLPKPCHTVTVGEPGEGPEVTVCVPPPYPGG